MTAYGAGQWVRGYYAFIQAAEESDYTQEIDERAYPYLQEIFSRSNPVLKIGYNGMIQSINLKII